MNAKKIEQPSYKITALGLGSDYFGACECCGKKVSETFKFTSLRYVKTSAGKTVTIKGAGVYGHQECVSRYVAI